MQQQPTKGSVSAQQHRQDRCVVSSLFQRLPPRLRSKIPQHYQDDIITKTNETIRILSSKVSPGQKLCGADSPEARAAVVLEHVLRQGVSVSVSKYNGQSRSTSAGRKTTVMTPSVRVPLETLGKLVGLKKKDIDFVGNAVQQHLNRININCNDGGGSGSKSAQSSKSIAGTGRRPYQSRRMMALKSNSNVHVEPNRTLSTQNKRTPILSKQVGTATSTSSASIPDTTDSGQDQESALTLRPKHMHNLSIKLQSRIHDFDTAANDSEHLFEKYLHHVLDPHNDHSSTNSNDVNISSKTSGQRARAMKRAMEIKTIRSDIESNQESYEGACFFIVGYQSENGNSSTTNSLPISDIRNIVKSYNKKENNRGRSKKKKNHEAKGRKADNLIDGFSLIDDIVNVLRLDTFNFLTIMESMLTNLESLHKSTVSNQSSSNISRRRGDEILQEKVTTNRKRRSNNSVQNQSHDNDTANLPPMTSQGYSRNDTLEGGMLNSKSAKRIRLNTIEESSREDMHDKKQEEESQRYVCREKFELWRKDVLAKAELKVFESLQNELKDPDGVSKKRFALEKAANDVLKQLGIKIDS